MNPQFEDLYKKDGRPSVAPEQLLTSRILMALFWVRSERLFCDQLGYNLLWLWFLDRGLEEGGFRHNQDRVLKGEIAAAFFREVYQLSREEDWASDEHFNADGPLIEAWASTESFRPRAAHGQPAVRPVEGLRRLVHRVPGWRTAAGAADGWAAVGGIERGQGMYVAGFPG